MAEPLTLVRSDLSGPGIRRRRHGRGFRYLSPDGTPVRDREELARIKALVIPPAWEDVWIAAAADAHIQAVGTDAAGRRQYRYHDLWREQRDREKHDRVLEFGAVLPRVRTVVLRHLDGRTLSRDRVLAAAIRLVDLGFFRPGGDEYAAENGSYGLATIRRDHVTCRRTELVFDYIGKSAQHREQAVADERVCAVVRSLKRRRGGGDGLLAYRSGPRWHDVTAADMNDYLREVSGDDFTAKDFRTWHATVLAAVGLAVSERAVSSETARKRAIARVVREVSGYLGNTPAVARASYIDPRVISLYEEGTTIAGGAGPAGTAERVRGAGHPGSSRGSRAATAVRPWLAADQASAGTRLAGQLQPRSGVPADDAQNRAQVRRQPVQHHPPLAVRGQPDDDAQPGQVSEDQAAQVQVNLVKVRGDLRELAGQPADGGLVDLTRQRIAGTRAGPGDGGYPQHPVVVDRGAVTELGGLRGVRRDHPATGGRGARLDDGSVQHSPEHTNASCQRDGINLADCCQRGPRPGEPAAR